MPNNLYEVFQEQRFVGIDAGMVQFGKLVSDAGMFTESHIMGIVSSSVETSFHSICKLEIWLVIWCIMVMSFNL